MTKTWQSLGKPTRDARILFRGRRFRIEEVQQTLDDGSKHPREVVRHPGAVVILPILHDQRVCLIHSFRAAVNAWIWELPAGTLEPGIPPDEQAARELREETGLRLGQLAHLHTFTMSPGILDERMHLYLASHLEQGEPEREVGEQIVNRFCTWSEIDTMLRNGEIVDAKTLVGLLWYLRYRQHA